MIHRYTGKKHMSLNVLGALAQIPNNNKLSFADNDKGMPITNKQLRAELKKADFEGKKLIPCGDCDNFCYQTGCRGHDSYTLLHDYEFEEGQG